MLGQDLETTDDGVFRIARRVAKDRVISTVDRQARRGHKTAACGFDGYKGHLAADPDSEIITDTEVSAGVTGVSACPLGSVAVPAVNGRRTAPSGRHRAEQSDC